MSFTKARNPSFFATKSVSQFTSTNTPTFALEMDVGRDDTFLGRTRRLLAGTRDSFCPAEASPAFSNRLRFRRGGTLAVHETCVGFLLPQLLHELRVNFD